MKFLSQPVGRKASRDRGFKGSRAIIAQSYQPFKEPFNIDGLVKSPRRTFYEVINIGLVLVC